MTRFVMAVVALLLVAAPSSAQQGNTSELRVVVIDETGAGIPGASIVVTPEGGQPVAFETDERGRGISPALPVGNAQLRIEFPGFHPHEGRVSLRRGAVNQTVTLRIEGFQEEIVVSDTAEIDLRSSSATTTLTQEEIDELPDDPDELQAVLEQMAGPGGATFIMNGFRGGRLPTRDEIRMIRFRTNSFSADNHDAGRTQIEIITRPATTFNGNVNLGLRGDVLNARNAMARVETPEGERNGQFGLRGPIVSGRTSFRFNVQGNSSYRSNTIIALDDAGAPLGSQVRVPTERSSFNGAIEHSLGRNQTLRLEYQRSETDSRNQGLGSFDYPERAFESQNANNLFRTQVQGLVGRTTLHEVRFQFDRRASEAASLTNAPAIIVQDAFNRGGAGVSNRRLVQQFEIADNLDFNVGRRHQMRVGLLLEGGHYETFDEQNKYGRFTFASLDAFRRGEPLQFTQRIGTVDTSFNQYQFAMYWQDEIRLNNRLSVGVGVRNEMQSFIDDRLNLMPRVGVTFSPGGNRMAIRGGYGLYYDWYEATLHDQTLRLNGVSQTDLLIQFPGYPDPFAGNLANQRVLPGGRTQAAPGLQMPYVHQASVSVERRLTDQWNVSASYQMLRGRNQLRARDINAPVDGVRPDPTVGIITQIESTGRSQTDRLTLQSRVQLPQQRMFFNVSYTLGQSKSHANGPTALPADSLDPDADWGPTGQDVRHQLQAQGMVPLPYGFRANIQFRAQSGPAYNLTTGRDDNLDGVVNDRPAGVSRNSLRGDPYWTISSLRLSKQIGFGGLRGEGGGPGPGGFGGPGMPGGPGGGPGGFDPGGGGPPPGVQNALQGGGRGGGGGGGRSGGFGSNTRYTMEIFVNASNPLNRVIPQAYSGNLLSPFFGQATSVQQARRVDVGVRFQF